MRLSHNIVYGWHCSIRFSISAPPRLSLKRSKAEAIRSTFIAVRLHSRLDDTGDLHLPKKLETRNLEYLSESLAAQPVALAGTSN
jgi:hypothetical protein